MARSVQCDPREDGMSKVQNKEKGQSVGNAFMGAADVLGTGVDALFGGSASDDFEIVVNLDDVEIRAQHPLS